jgi:hypothetical protein
MLDKDIQDKITDQIINRVDDFDEDNLRKIKDVIDKRLNDKYSIEQKYKEFINLYERANHLIDRLYTDQHNISFDMWEYIWERLFNKNGLYHQASQIYQFSWCNIDSSYEDEVNYCMDGWRIAVDEIKEKLKIEQEQHIYDIL